VSSAETAAIVEREVRVEASPATIYDFLIEPDKMIQWFGRIAELDPRPGGTFRVDINGKHIARGEYVELDPPNRVVFTFGWEGDDSSVAPGKSTVEVTLSADGDATLVRLAHSELPDDAREPHAHGWVHYLERLQVAGAGGDPGEDPWSDPEHTSRYEETKDQAHTKAGT
jgi:uncharacterized protein YndB with AHSA1/START domain